MFNRFFKKGDDNKGPKNEANAPKPPPMPTEQEPPQQGGGFFNLPPVTRNPAAPGQPGQPHHPSGNYPHHGAHSNTVPQQRHPNAGNPHHGPPQPQPNIGQSPPAPQQKTWNPSPQPPPQGGDLFGGMALKTQSRPPSTEAPSGGQSLFK